MYLGGSGYSPGPADDFNFDGGVFLMTDHKNRPPEHGTPEYAAKEERDLETALMVVTVVVSAIVAGIVAVVVGMLRGDE
jgi:hypothetical protein